MGNIGVAAGGDQISGARYVWYVGIDTRDLAIPGTRLPVNWNNQLLFKSISATPWMM